MPAVHLQENSKLISGHVAEKKGYLYWVLNLTDENGKRKPKWIPTHKKVKGNKTWANNMLPTIRKEWTEKLLQEATASQQSASPSGPSSAAISFVDFLYQWLEYKYKSATGRVMDSKPIELSTYRDTNNSLTTPSPRISESILSPFVTLPNKIFSLFMRKNWNGSSRPPLNITTL
mgnify:CR=1 FL=1